MDQYDDEQQQQHVDQYEEGYVQESAINKYVGSRQAKKKAEEDSRLL